MCPLAVLMLQCRSNLCLHPVNVFSLWCFYRESFLLLRFLLVGRVLLGFVLSSLRTESKALVKSTNNVVACRIFARTPSTILRIVNICEPFWFFRRMLSILGSMRLRSRALYILAAMDVSVIPR